MARSNRSNFQRGAGMFSCEVCTRNTRGSHGSNVRMCTECYDLSGIANEIEDETCTEHEAAERAQPLITACLEVGGSIEHLQSAFAWAFWPE